MTLQRRVANLEKSDPSGSNLPEIAFVHFVDMDGTSNPGFAVIVAQRGEPGLQVDRHENEDPEAFYRRAYAVKAGRKQVEDMTEEERAAAYAAGDAIRAEKESNQ